jgi:hypothetical protein
MMKTHDFTGRNCKIFAIVTKLREEELVKAVELVEFK